MHIHLSNGVLLDEFMLWQNHFYFHNQKIKGALFIKIEIIEYESVDTVATRRVVTGMAAWVRGTNSLSAEEERENGFW